MTTGPTYEVLRKLGLATRDDAHHYISRWHVIQQPKPPLAEFLGMSEDEYAGFEEGLKTRSDRPVLERILIRDVNASLIHALKLQQSILTREEGMNIYGLSTSVLISDGSIFDLVGDAIVSPANSFGFMDGGIDELYLRFFGQFMQGLVQDHIRRHFGGELLVGQSFVVPTTDRTIRNMIVAPTMRTPAPIKDHNAIYLATRAAIKCALAHGFKTVLLPGMGTGTGRVNFSIAAKCMLEGIRDAITPPAFPSSLAIPALAENNRGMV